MITTTERQENIIDQYGRLINPSKARVMRAVGLGIVESRREGPYVWDQCGTRYIDCRDNSSIYNIGRRNPVIIEKLKEALDEYDIGNNVFFSEPRLHLAQKLGAISPNRELQAAAFGASGGEINDFAIKLARAWTGRSKIISMRQGYHGCTGYSLAVSSSPTLRAPFGPGIPDCKKVPFGDVDALEECIGVDTACVILEPIQSWGGVRLPPDGYLQKVRKLCDQTGALLIADEIMTGLGRTGKMFACDHYGLVPDIMTLGKSLSGGVYPITMAIFKKKFLSFWEDHPFSHLSTFGGSDLGCIVALATINYIEENKISEKCARSGERLGKGFDQICDRYPEVIKGFHQKGLLMAAEFIHEATGPQMSRDLSQFGVLAAAVTNNPSMMRILPSLTISDEDVDLILDAFDHSLAGSQWIVPNRPTEPEFSLERFLAYRNAKNP